MKKVIALSFLALTLTACGLVKLPGSDQITIIRTGAPKGNCKEVGQISATTTADTSALEDRTEREIRNQALVMGANTVKISSVVRGKQGGIDKIYGTAYQCY